MAPGSAIPTRDGPPSTASLPWYAGIGSRESPREILELMARLARALAEAGYGLRSGGGRGADVAFEAGSGDGPTQIFLPWPGFGERAFAARPWTAGSDFSQLRGAIALDHLPSIRDTFALAARFHPGWSRLRGPAQRLIARNGPPVLGPDLRSPSRFVLCWAPRPKFNDVGQVIDVEGGTGQGVRIAAAHGIPIFHLGVPLHARRLERFLKRDAPLEAIN